jgi:hypothetical protein
MLLMEHDNLKIENQELCNDIFKHREEAIQIRSSSDQKALEMQD